MTKATLLKTENAEGIAFGVLLESYCGKTYIYPEIADHRSSAERLIRRLEQSDLSPVHYVDVVRDYILEQAFERLRRNGLE